MAPPHRSRNDGRSQRARAVSDNRTGGSSKQRNAQGRMSMSQYYDNAQINQSSRVRSVGDFVLGKTIGEGTFGKVKLGKHLITSEKVAIKILERSRMKDTADVTRVTREIKILKRNIHPNVIQLYEVIDSSTAIYLIMEHIDGGELFDYIVSHQRLQEPQACFFFHQICDGLEYLHRMDVTHRDLKPENLLLQSSPKGWIVKIVDFGLSNTHEGGRLLVTACGSPCYAAPEMIAGKKYVGPKADMWSLGVVLYAMVCGYLPFEESTTAKLYQKILAGDYKSPNFISKDVRNLIRSILNTDPKRRFYVKDIRQHPWYNIIDMPANSIIKHSNSRPEVSHLNEDVLFQLEGLGQRREDITESVCNGVHNTASTSYYLMAKKLHRQGRRARVDPAAGISPSAMPSVANSAANSAATSAANLGEGGGNPHSLSAMLAKMNMNRDPRPGRRGDGGAPPQPQGARAAQAQEPRRKSGMQAQAHAGHAPPLRPVPSTKSSSKEDAARAPSQTANIPKIPITQRPGGDRRASYSSTQQSNARPPMGITNVSHQGAADPRRRQLPWQGKQDPQPQPGITPDQSAGPSRPRGTSDNSGLAGVMPGFHPSRPSSSARSRLSARPPSRGRNNSGGGLVLQLSNGSNASSNSNSHHPSRPASNFPSRTASPRSQASPASNGIDANNFRGGRRIIARPGGNNPQQSSGNDKLTAPPRNSDERQSSGSHGAPQISGRASWNEQPQPNAPTQLVTYKKQNQTQPPAITSK